MPRFCPRRRDRLPAFAGPCRTVRQRLSAHVPATRASPRLIGADASHAWLSLYCGPLGWVDGDPTNAGASWHRPRDDRRRPRLCRRLPYPGRLRRRRRPYDERVGRRSPFGRKLPGLNCKPAVASVLSMLPGCQRARCVYRFIYCDIAERALRAGRTTFRLLHRCISCRQRPSRSSSPSW